MKKLLSVVLVISMLFSFAVPFTAAADEVTATDDRVWFEFEGNSRLFVKSDE